MAPMVAVWCSDHSAFLIHSSRSSGLVRITCAHLVPGMLNDFEAEVEVKACMAVCRLIEANGTCVWPW